jgi:beta-lactamase superfamily II metal-dependent hydrolase
MMRLHMLPAFEGDCLILEYGEDEGHLHRVLIDGGREETAPQIQAYLDELPAKQRRFELVIVSHIDCDHIDGILGFLRNAPDGSVGHVWFNGPSELKKEPPVPMLAGPGTWAKAVPQGNKLLGLLGRYAWNSPFNGDAVAVWQPPQPITGGLTLTIVSPDKAGLDDLEPKWEQANIEAGLLAGTQGTGHKAAEEEFEAPGSLVDVLRLASADTPFKGDDSETNHSSIAVVARYGKQRVLLAGDAHERCLTQSLVALSKPHADRVPFDLVKLPHHGSKANMSQRLLATMDCRRFAVSTNGDSFNHPDAACIAKVVTHRRGVQLYFNYETDMNRCWKNDEWRASLGYDAEYGDKGLMTITV